MSYVLEVYLDVGVGYLCMGGELASSRVGL